ncbi:hypothetical protein, partial [Crocosphaera sp. Alani8]|uniref:hypothetical protein n=1 Tax=Crocosphaera sp. Alani8 TaxID=3038952 RepID=UPI00313DC629
FMNMVWNFVSSGARCELYIVMMMGYGPNYFGDGFSSLIQLNDNIAFSLTIGVFIHSSDGTGNVHDEKEKLLSLCCQC